MTPSGLALWLALNNLITIRRYTQRRKREFPRRPSLMPLINERKLSSVLLTHSPALWLWAPMVQKYLPFLKKYKGLRDDNKHQLFCFTHFRIIKNYLRKDLVTKDVLWIGWWLPFLVWEQRLSTQSDCTQWGKNHSVYQIHTKDVIYVCISYISLHRKDIFFHSQLLDNFR